MKIYLTIDDCPSKNTTKKVDFLLEHEIQAIFYARGEFIQKYEQQLIYAIQKGFLVGNHSYSHRRFSELTLNECFDEIEKTEELLESTYRKAGLPRRMKVIRFPFGDRGAGQCGASGSNQEEIEKVVKLQDFLKKQGFEKVIFRGSKTEDSLFKGAEAKSYIDSLWDWDPQDYKSKNMQNPEHYLHQFGKLLQKMIQETTIAKKSALDGTLSQADSAKSSQKTESKIVNDQVSEQAVVLLLHDFDQNHHLFELTMRFLLEKRVNFRSTY